MNNIVLIGMSGAGKSTIGVLLAKAINKSFMDTDLLLQQKYHRLLHEIIHIEGIEVFKEYEEKMLVDINCENKVIATGGSVVYSHKGMKHLKTLGKVVYIKVDYENIAGRLKDIKTRGVVMAPGQSLKALYEERQPLYEEYADVILNVDYESVEETLLKLIQQLNS